MTTSNKEEPLYPERIIGADDKINTSISIKVSPINDEAKSIVSNSGRAYIDLKTDTRTNEFFVETIGLSYNGDQFNLDELIDALLLIKSVNNRKGNKNGTIS